MVENPEYARVSPLAMAEEIFYTISPLVKDDEDRIKAEEIARQLALKQLTDQIKHYEHLKVVADDQIAHIKKRKNWFDAFSEGSIVAYRARKIYYHGVINLLKEKYRSLFFCN